MRASLRVRTHMDARLELVEQHMIDPYSNVDQSDVDQSDVVADA